MERFGHSGAVRFWHRRPSDAPTCTPPKSTSRTLPPAWPPSRMMLAGLMSLQAAQCRKAASYPSPMLFGMHACKSTSPCPLGSSS